MIRFVTQIIWVRLLYRGPGETAGAAVDQRRKRQSGRQARGRLPHISSGAGAERATDRGGTMLACVVNPLMTGTFVGPEPLA